MKPLSFEHIFPGGDLFDRIWASKRRLDMEGYSAGSVFKPAPYDWPGDNEGRTLLAQVLLARASHSEPAHLEAILDRLPNELNSRGYFGRILPDGLTDEQQLAGNSWYLRALCEYYLWKGRSETLSRIEQVIRELVLPTKGRFDSYPDEPSERVKEGEAAGKLSEHPIRNWYLSSDIGCAFILLDGATQAYDILKWQELRDVIEEMIASFLKMDLLAISAQTHATLSALRGILRFYGLTGDLSLLQAAVRVFSLYENEGMTENYANYNWFNRPWWTEPCAVVDAYLTAVDLWRYTNQPAYLEQAHLIYFNAISHGQRHNGGFGCDNCSGATEPHLFALANTFEAYWCCTMRGGEGLSRAAQFGYWLSEKAVALPFYHDSVAKLEFPEGECIVRQSTSYPYAGSVRMEIISSCVNARKTVKCFIPSWASSTEYQVKINGQTCPSTVIDGFAIVDMDMRAGSKLELTFDFGLQQKSVVNKHSIQGKVMLRHGPLIMYSCSDNSHVLPKITTLHDAGQAVYCDDAGEARLRPVYVPFHASDKSWSLLKKQILFDVEEV